MMVIKVYSRHKPDSVLFIVMRLQIKILLTVGDKNKKFIQGYKIVFTHEE